MLLTNTEEHMEVEDDKGKKETSDKEEGMNYEEEKENKEEKYKDKQVADKYKREDEDGDNSKNKIDSDGQSIREWEMGKEKLQREER